MDVKPGYKQTEVGVIPAEWQTERLGDLATFRTGPFGSALHKADYTNDGVPIVNPMHIIDGKIIPSRTMTISESSAARLSDFRLKPGEIVIGRRGGMGRCAVVCQEHLGWLCGTGSMIVRPSNRVDAHFLQRVLSSPSVVSAIEDSSVGSTMINLNQSTLSELFIQTPSILEQRAIASALSDVDALIAALDRLIAKKRDIKQAAMQELLTGKRRLPGFSGELSSVCLGELGSFSKGRGIKKDDVVAIGIPCIRYGEIYTYYYDYIREFHSFISEDIADESHPIKSGDLLFAGSGETAKEIGKCVAYLEDNEAYAGGDIVIFSPKKQDSMYLGYLMNHSSIVIQKEKMGQGDAVVHISAKNLAELRLKLPSLAEQAAIASVLSDMDAEIAALEARREKTRALKQGMMQELLTGRIRLV